MTSIINYSHPSTRPIWYTSKYICRCCVQFYKWCMWFEYGPLIFPWKQWTPNRGEQNFYIFRLQYVRTHSKLYHWRNFTHGRYLTLKRQTTFHSPKCILQYRLGMAAILSRVWELMIHPQNIYCTENKFVLIPPEPGPMCIPDVEFLTTSCLTTWRHSNRPPRSRKISQHYRCWSTHIEGMSDLNRMSKPIAPLSPNTNFHRSPQDI